MFWAQSGSPNGRYPTTWGQPLLARSRSAPATSALFDNAGIHVVHVVINVTSDHWEGVECMEKLARNPEPEIDDSAVFIENGPVLLCLGLAAFQQVHEIEREGEDDGGTALTGDDIERRKIAELHGFGTLAKDFRRL